MSELSRKNFFSALFEHTTAGRVNIRLIPPSKSKGGIKNFFVPLNKVEEVSFPQDCNVYFAPATRNGSGRKEDIVQIPALWIDVDFKNTAEEEANELLRSFPLPPSAVVGSGGGLHVYWFLKEPEDRQSVDVVETMLKRLAFYFKADTSVTDASHILRVPDTLNCKYTPPRVVRLISLDSEARYEISDFDLYLPEVEDKASYNADNEGASRGPIDLDSLPISLPVKKLIKHGVPRPERSEAIFSVIQNLLKAKVPYEVIREVFEQYPIGEKYREKGPGRERWLQGEIQRAKDKMGTNTKSKGPKPLTLNDLEELFSVETKWLWRNHIPMAQPIILNGREGVGKTTIAMVAAKEILETHSQGSVLWLATEGKVLDCKNKMLAIGLEDRFYVASKSDGTFKFNFEHHKDLKELDTILSLLDKPILAVFIDSIRGMTSLGDNEDKVGGVMHKVNALVCDKYHAALVYIDHWGKSKKSDLLDRNVGTTAKTAAVSAVLSVIKRTGYTRDIRVAKSNIGQIPDLISIQKGNQIVVSQPFQESGESVANRTEEFLLRLGAQKSVWPVSEVERKADLENLNMEVIYKVKRKLGIKSQKNINGHWEWVWPV